MLKLNFIVAVFIMNKILFVQKLLNKWLSCKSKLIFTQVILHGQTLFVLKGYTKRGDAFPQTDIAHTQSCWWTTFWRFRLKLRIKLLETAFKAYSSGNVHINGIVNPCLCWQVERYLQNYQERQSASHFCHQPSMYLRIIRCRRSNLILRHVCRTDYCKQRKT